MAEYKPPAPAVQVQDLKVKVALVTGATKGIGRAIALDLTTRGCSLLGTYSSPESAHNFDTLSHTVHDLYRTSTSTSAPTAPNPHAPVPSAPEFHGVAADITSLSSVPTLVSELSAFLTKTETHKLDILILSASINLRPVLGTPTPTYASAITTTLTANLHWPLLLMQHLVSHNLFNPNARIVILSSDRVRDPTPGASLFAATKAGLESLARSWACELPLTFPGTTVNAVSVGLTDTPGLRAFPAEAVEALMKVRVPKVKVVTGGRVGFAEDVADVVGWLVSEKARWVTGSVVAANGGAEWVGGSS